MWQVLRGQSNVLRGNWRWVQAKHGADYMVRGDHDPGYASWIDVGAGKGRTLVENGRRP